jgi:hypothetical protein
MNESKITFYNNAATGNWYEFEKDRINTNLEKN